MAAVSHRRRFVCFPIGKAASSSLKDVVFQLDVGRSFTQQDETEIGCGLDRLYPTPHKEPWLRFYGGYTSLVIVRDPIRRLVSVYADRVIKMKSLQRSPDMIAAFAEKRLSVTPTLSEFVDNLEAYLALSRYTQKHLYPQALLIGAIWPRIKHRLPLERVSEVPQIIQSELGVPVTLPHEHKSEQSASALELSPRQLRRLRKRYAEDYEMLKDFYSPEALESPMGKVTLQPIR